MLTFRDSLPLAGMGPYIPEPGTWVSDDFHRTNPGIDTKAHLAEMMQLTTVMNSLARITLGNVNIAATTSLQVLHRRLWPARLPELSLPYHTWPPVVLAWSEICLARRPSTLSDVSWPSRAAPTW